MPNSATSSLDLAQELAHLATFMTNENTLQLGLIARNCSTLFLSKGRLIEIANTRLDFLKERLQLLVLNMTKHILISSIRKGSLGRSRSSASLSSGEFDILLTLTTLNITHSVNRQTLSVRLRSRSELILIICPNRSDTGRTFIEVRDRTCFRKTCINLIENCTKTLGKSVRFSSRSNKIKERILILNARCFGQRFNTLRILQLDLRVGQLGLLLHLKQRLRTLLESRADTFSSILHLWRRRDRRIGSANALRLKSTRSGNERIHACSLHGSTLSGRRIVFPIDIITIRQSECILISHKTLLSINSTAGRAEQGREAGNKRPNAASNI